jgi:hypothetical protein
MGAFGDYANMPKYGIRMQLYIGANLQSWKKKNGLNSVVGNVTNPAPISSRYIHSTTSACFHTV